MTLTKPIVGLLILACVSVASVADIEGCKNTSPPTAAQVEAGARVANYVCSLVEGIDDNGVFRTICATVEEVAQIVAFIATLRKMTDGGQPPALITCINLPNTQYCATSSERAKGILFLMHARANTYLRDAGTDR